MKADCVRISSRELSNKYYDDNENQCTWDVFLFFNTDAAPSPKKIPRIRQWPGAILLHNTNQYSNYYKEKQKKLFRDSSHLISYRWTLVVNQAGPSPIKTGNKQYFRMHTNPESR